MSSDNEESSVQDSQNIKRISNQLSDEKETPSGNNNIDKSDYQLIDKPSKIYKRPYDVRYAIGLGNYKKKKEYSSWLKGRTGPDHPSFKHGQSKTSRMSYGSKYTAWIIGVKQKYNFQCLITGESKKELLECHHLDSFSLYPERRFLIENGVVIHKDIHKHFHQLYGSSVNALQFEDFLIKYYNWGDKVFPWRQGNHEPSLSVEQIEQQLLNSYEKLMMKFLELCESNNHSVIDGEYLGIHSAVTIQCNKHGDVITTTFKNYKNSKHGLRCCGKEAQKNKAEAYNRDSTGKYTL